MMMSLDLSPGWLLKFLLQYVVVGPPSYCIMLLEHTPDWMHMTDLYNVTDSIIRTTTGYENTS